MARLARARYKPKNEVMIGAKKILRYSLIAVVILLLAGLWSWYSFLNKQKQTISGNDAARGLGTESPSFENTIGSTYNNIVTGITTLVGNTGSSGNEGGKTLPQLWQITKTPVAGMGFAGSASSSRLLFAERSTGYVLQADLKTGALTRLTNKTFPKVYEAVFGNGGDVVLRFVDEGGSVMSFAGAVTASGQATSSRFSDLTGKYLESGISAITPSSKTRELLYLAQGPQGGTAAVRASWDGQNKKLLFSSPLSNWRLMYPSDGRIFLLQSPADDSAGYAYELKSDGSLSPQIQGVPGLTFLPQTASSAYLFGASLGGELALFARVREDSSVVSLPIKTVADKCVWVPDLSALLAETNRNPVRAPSKELVAYCAVPQFISSTHFLNDWYRGAVHTSDDWWRVDASAGTVELVYSPNESETVIDVESPAIDERGENIAFMNARDKTLWILRIEK